MSYSSLRQTGHGAAKSETHSSERSAIRVAGRPGRIVLEVVGRNRRVGDTACFLVPVLSSSASTLDSTSQLTLRRYGERRGISATGVKGTVTSCRILRHTS